MTLIISQYPTRTNMIMHVFLDHVRDIFLDHVKEESENLIIFAAEMIWPHL